MKTCSTCKETKNHTEFYKQARNKDGLFGQCKFCINEKRKERSETINAKQRKYYQNNKQYYITKGHLRAKGVKQAKPRWLTEDHEFFIEEIYSLRDLRTEVTGVVHHVDHIVPLKGKDVCGLHVPWNLQVITAKDNLSKSNSLRSP
jgi:hypothetical protein